MFARYSRRSDVSIGHCSSAGDKCVYNVSALPAFAEFDATRRGGAYRRSPACRERVSQGPLYCGIQYTVLQTAVNIVYWLLPPISQTLVTRSCRSPTANKPRAVIWCRCLPFLVPSDKPRFDEFSIFRLFDNTSTRQKKVFIT